MNIKKYQVFVQAVELGSLSKASEKLDYTQSGISHMMQSLENEIGFPLIVRTPTGIQLNPDGEILLPVIRQLLNASECLEQSIARIRGCDIGRIRIASFSSVATCWLPHILRSFQEDCPNVEIEILEDGAEAINRMMENREADLCLYSGGEEQNFRWIPLYGDPLQVLVPPGHPLLARGSFPMQDLVCEQFIMPMAGYDYEVHHILDTLPHYPHIRFSSCNDYAIISMVNEGLGISILPKLLLDHYPGTVATLPLDPPTGRILGMGVHQTASPVARKFMRYVTDYVRALDGALPVQHAASATEEGRQKPVSGTAENTK